MLMASAYTEWIPTFNITTDGKVQARGDYPPESSVSLSRPLIALGKGRT
ncbi:hypothetical protein [Klebsiella pneumoniae IS22]|nr:hypothetical protein [Klebsiella pneumoniae IS22]